MTLFRTSKRRWIRALALVAGLGLATANAPCEALGRYGGSVRYYIADLKPSFPEHQSYSAATALTAGNYRSVLEGLRTAAGVNGIRVPIIPSKRQAAEYSPLYGEIYAYARSLGFLIYASPMSVGMRGFAGWSDEQYAAWLADYANTFHPDVLSPFNEAGIDDARMAAIVAVLRPNLPGGVRLAGPDRQHLAKTLQSLSGPVVGLFDIVDSHNANGDPSATAGNWSRLAGGGHPTWSSENPAGWSRGRGASIPGIDQAVAGGVEAVVIWEAKPSLVDDRGQPTAKAREIAAHLMGGQ